MLILKGKNIGKESISIYFLFTKLRILRLLQNGYKMYEKLTHDIYFLCDKREFPVNDSPPLTFL